MANLAPSFVSLPSESCRGSLLGTTRISAIKLKVRETEQTHLKLGSSSRKKQGLRRNASKETPGLMHGIRKDEYKTAEQTEGYDSFNEMKQRFLTFKEKKYLENLELYHRLAESQAPEFMVIACADSRVCPSVILGLEPGEAFTVRNVANLVPPFESGPSETNAALEFAVNSLKVKNILVIGHSCCGGIRALMSMENTDGDNSSSFIRSWVIVGKNARLSTKEAASHLSLDQQCRHCEKESVNRSLLNLLTYPWIEEQVMRGNLSLHGGYYNFVDCSFEKWTLDYYKTISRGNKDTIAVTGRSFWS
ncbi:beta carbonic anhydrase 5, chloroplastic isoform X1 [Syzygium oleosum]|uniref:beta carbonic anhydrase 5, chloroplastic isoform X1 n=1 Tax=Syzygium oleosum TaxID=219896 RepID=UPI0011D1FE0A|nr:beta carbonic anhydrase 5, chloroplastic isoform X1 [Syzygium oleosum]